MRMAAAPTLHCRAECCQRGGADSRREARTASCRGKALICLPARVITDAVGRGRREGDDNRPVVAERAAVDAGGRITGEPHVRDAAPQARRQQHVVDRGVLAARQAVVDAVAVAVKPARSPCMGHMHACICAGVRDAGVRPGGACRCA